MGRGANSDVDKLASEGNSIKRNQQKQKGILTKFVFSADAEVLTNFDCHLLIKFDPPKFSCSAGIN